MLYEVITGLYIFMLEGKADIEGQSLEERDGYGIWETAQVSYNFV